MKKKDRVVYWSVTGVWAVVQVIPGFMNFFVPTVAERFRALGYPQHLRVTSPSRCWRARDGRQPLQLLLSQAVLLA